MPRAGRARSRLAATTTTRVLDHVNPRSKCMYMERYTCRHLCIRGGPERTIICVYLVIQTGSSPSRFRYASMNTACRAVLLGSTRLTHPQFCSSLASSYNCVASHGTSPAGWNADSGDGSAPPRPTTHRKLQRVRQGRRTACDTVRRHCSTIDLNHCEPLCHSSCTQAGSCILYYSSAVFCLLCIRRCHEVHLSRRE